MGKSMLIRSALAIIASIIVTGTAAAKEVVPDPMPVYTERQKLEAEIARRMQYLQDCTNCPEMAIIPAGTYRMGASDTGPEIVFRKPFAIGRTEVTFNEWNVCVIEGGCTSKPEDAGWGRGRRPVINVSFADAQQFATWLSKRTKQDYRLPSEAEWEFAARAGTSGVFSFGDQEALLCKYANTAATGVAPCAPEPVGRTSIIGDYLPNNFGLYDMHGNVAEWVADCWHAALTKAPTDGKAWTRNCDSKEGVARGGSFRDGPRDVASSSRVARAQDAGSPTLGFRVARTMK